MAAPSDHLPLARCGEQRSFGREGGCPSGHTGISDTHMELWKGGKGSKSRLQLPASLVLLRRSFWYAPQARWVAPLQLHASRYETFF